MLHRNTHFLEFPSYTLYLTLLSNITRMILPIPHQKPSPPSPLLSNMTITTTTTTAATSDWQTLASRKRAALYDKIPPSWRLPSSTTAQFSATTSTSVLHIPRTSGILTPRDLDLTDNYTASSLVAMMLAKEASSYEVTLAFCKRAALAQQCVNCLTEIFFDKALERARECDAFLEREGRGMGPLHGLPISVKVCIPIIILYYSISLKPPFTKTITNITTSRTHLTFQESKRL